MLHFHSAHSTYGSVGPTVEEIDDGDASLGDKDHAGDPMDFCPDLSQRVNLDK
jgi:hypothetical protein